jgi:hypothetical protein
VRVLWFRRDLRLRDNPALHEAQRGDGDVVPLFVLDNALWGRAGPNRRAFLAECLRALDESLDGRLVVRHGDPQRIVAEVANGDPVFAAEDFGPYGRRRDDALLDAGVDLRLAGSLALHRQRGRRALRRAARRDHLQGGKPVPGVHTVLPRVGRPRLGAAVAPRARTALGERRR